jgi:hypothetical protein
MNEDLAGLKDKVRLILLNEWDPIGIQDEPGAQDEYDSYVSLICEMICSGKTIEELYLHLRSIECDCIGLDGGEIHTKSIANKLSKLG